MSRLGELTIILATGREFEWRIADFTSLLEEYYCSPLFSFAGTTWKLCIYPNGSKSTSGYINLFLGRNDVDPPISLEVSLGLKTLKGEKYYEQKFTKPCISDSDLEAYGKNRFLPRAELLKRKSKLLPSNVLTVVGALKHLKSIENATAETETAKCPHCKELVNNMDITSHGKKCVNRPIKCPECSVVVALKNWYDHECHMAKGELYTSGSSTVFDVNKLQNDFKKLFLNKEDCDVVIKVQGQELLAHKNILKARSPVLASTFRNDIKEKAAGVMYIEDCEPSSFYDFLCFLYCGEARIVSKENVCNLFTTSDKYQVEDLRAECVKFMIEKLSVDTFCDTMTLAIRHSERDLVKISTDFFIKNAPKIIATAKWRAFVSENPTQSNELFVKFLLPENGLIK